MKASEALRAYESQLKAAGVGTARLDCLVLLEDVLNTNRTQILAHLERELTEVEAHALQAMVDKRTMHIPLAYIRHKTEFYGREFYVDERVLEPRPESETMIEILKQLRLPANPRIADVGTGSGALGITTAAELHAAHIDLLDIDSGALDVASKNTSLHSSPARTLRSDLLANTSEPYDVLLCNLPYVPDNFQINRAATHEPDIALFGGPDGLDLYRQLFEQIQERAHQPGYILTESLPPQHEPLTAIATAHGYHQAQEEDFIQLFVSGRLAVVGRAERRRQV